MKKFITAILVFLIVSSCKKEDYSYKGPVLVDFPFQYQRIVIKGNTNKDTTVNISIRLVGPQQGNDKNITFSVDPASSAISGTHYSIEGTSAAIPANSSYGSIPVKFLVPSFPEQTSVRIVLNLTGGDITPNENYKQTVLEIYRQGFIDNFLGKYSCEEPDKPVSVKYDVTIVADTSVKNRALISNFWGFAKEGTTVYMDLKSLVDSAYIPSQDFTDKLNRVYTLSGKGRYNINDGSINIDYTLAQKNSSYSEQGTQRYRKK